MTDHVEVVSKTAIVTGASGGIGEAFARLLAADGHRVVLVARSATKLDQLAGEIGNGASVVAADLSDPGAPAQVMASVAGPVDVLVNNAGFGDFGAFHAADPTKTDEMIELNVGALTRLTRLALPGMVERGSGRVLNVASTAAFQPGPLMAVYYATKAYVLSFSEAVAEELRGTGVTVTALCPGPVDTGFQAAAEMEHSKLVKDRSMPTAAEVAAFGYAAMQKGKVVAVPGLRNRLLASSIRVTPRPVARRVVHKMQEAAH